MLLAAAAYGRGWRVHGAWGKGLFFLPFFLFVTLVIIIFFFVVIVYAFLGDVIAGFAAKRVTDAVA